MTLQSGAMNSLEDSSSSCRAASTDISDPLSPFLPIVIASGWSSGLHPVSSHSCWMYVRAGPCFCPAKVGIHRSTSLMSSSLLLQQWPACLVRLIWIVFVMGGRWLYSWCLVEYCRQDLFNIARSYWNFYLPLSLKNVWTLFNAIRTSAITTRVYWERQSSRDIMAYVQGCDIVVCEF